MGRRRGIGRAARNIAVVQGDTDFGGDVSSIASYGLSPTVIDRVCPSGRHPLPSATVDVWYAEYNHSLAAHAIACATDTDKFRSDLL